MTQSRAIWWVKRDMRLRDNEALSSAISHHQQVIGLFICEPSLYNAPDTSPMHVFAWWQALSDLQKGLRDIGGELYFAKGEATAVFEHLFNRYRFDAIYSHEETGNTLTYERDKSVLRWCESRSVKWSEKSQNGVVRGCADRDKRTEIAHTRLFETEPVAAPVRIQAWPIEADSIIDTHWPEYSQLCSQAVDKRIQFHLMQQINEHRAQCELTHFLDDRVGGYSRGISSPNTGAQLAYEMYSFKVHRAVSNYNNRAAKKQRTGYATYVRFSLDFTGAIILLSDWSQRVTWRIKLLTQCLSRWFMKMTLNYCRHG